MKVPIYALTGAEKKSLYFDSAPVLFDSRCRS
jgi:hypothetical protein